MKTERVISFDGKNKIYHKPECRYAKRILHKNLVSLPKDCIQKEGYRICKCCNNMSYHLGAERESMNFYKSNRGMDFKEVEGILYVKTSISCWKILYTRGAEKMVLFHRNYSPVAVDFENPQKEHYHRQKDVPYVNSIKDCLKYIYEHDQYKEAVYSGKKVIRYTKEKYRKSAVKREKKKQQRRMDYLFSMIESQDESLKRVAIF